MTTITALPTPPSRADSTNFSTRGDAFLGALPTFVTEANAVGSEATAAAAAAAASASAAAASQSTASTAAAAVAAQSPVANAAAAAASAAAAAASAAAAAQTSGAVAATTLSASSTVSGAGFSAYLASPPAIGGTAPAAVAATTLSASSTVSGAGFSAYLASPPAIGGTAAAAVSATALSYTTTLTGGTGIVNLGSGQFYKDASGNVGVGKTPVAGRGLLQVNGDVEMTSQNTGQLAGLRNRIINGGMTIDQRNAGAAVTPTTPSAYILDRYSYNSSAASKITIQQVADAPTGFKYSTKLLVATQYSPTSTQAFNFNQPIEGFNCIDLALGTASAAVICISIWVKGSVAGTYSVSLRNSAGARSYVGTVSVTSSWEKQTITLTGDTTGTWLTDSGVGVYLTFDLGSGTNWNATAGSWQAGNFTRTAGSVTFVNQTAGATLNITGVQLELGSTATPFEQRPYGMELALCQRYYYRILGSATSAIFSGGYSPNTTTVSTTLPFPVAMRTAPTALEQSGTASNYGVGYLTGGALCTSVPLYSATTSNVAATFTFTTSAVMTAGQGAYCYGNTGAYLGWSAEL